MCLLRRRSIYVMTYDRGHIYARTYPLAKSYIVNFWWSPKPYIYGLSDWFCYVKFGCKKRLKLLQVLLGMLVGMRAGRDAWWDRPRYGTAVLVQNFGSWTPPYSRQAQGPSIYPPYPWITRVPGRIDEGPLLDIQGCFSNGPVSEDKGPVNHFW